MRIKYCGFCGLLLSEECNCLEELAEIESKSHLNDFLRVEHADEFQMSYSEECSMLEWAEHRMG